MSDETARYRLSAKAEKERADAAEAKATELEERLHDQLVRGAATIGKVTDSEAAWRLTDLSAVRVREDGTATGMEEAIAVTVRAYPYLAPEDPDKVDGTTKALRDCFPALEPSGRPTNGPPKGAEAANLGALERKFPALRNRR